MVKQCDYGGPSVYACAKHANKMVSNKKIESVHFIESIVNSLNVGIIAFKRLQSSVKEVSILDIYKDYVVTHRQTDRQTDTHTHRHRHTHTQTNYYNPLGLIISYVPTKSSLDVFSVSSSIDSEGTTLS